MLTWKDRLTHVSFEGDAPTVDYLIGILNDADFVTRWKTQDMTLDMLDYRYADGWNTVGALLSHIIAVKHVIRIKWLEKRELTADEEQWLAPGLKLGEYVSQLKGKDIDTLHKEMREAHALLIEAAKKVTDAELQDVNEFETYQPVTGANLAWVLYHIAEDEIHHRGQITILKKLYLDKHQ